jgi:hypothetical protein
MSQARVALSTNAISSRRDQRSYGVVDIRDATLCFGRSLVAADGGLARQVAYNRLEHRTRRQGSARVDKVTTWATPGVSDLSSGTSSVMMAPRQARSGNYAALDPLPTGATFELRARPAQGAGLWVACSPAAFHSGNPSSSRRAR